MPASASRLAECTNDAMVGVRALSSAMTDAGTRDGAVEIAQIAPGQPRGQGLEGERLSARRDAGALLGNHAFEEVHARSSRTAAMPAVTSRSASIVARARPLSMDSAAA